MNRTLPFFAAATAAATLLSGCAGGQDAVVITSTQWVDPDSGKVVDAPSGDPAPSQEQTQAQELDWIAEYGKVLDDPGAFDFRVANPTGVSVEFEPTGEYRYALVEANGGGNPELLLAAASVDAWSNHFDPVLVFTTDGEKGAVPSPNALTMGAAGAGGARLVVEASQLGRGLYQSRYSSGTGLGDTVWCELNGTTISPAVEPQDFAVSFTPPLHLPINWTPSTDRGPLQAGELTISLPEEPARTPVAGPDVVVEGNVVKKTGAELIDRMPNGEDPASEYILLQLDAPQEFTDHHHAGSVYTSTTEYVALGMNERAASGYTHIGGLEWETLVGQRVRLTMAPGEIWYQTDATMPMGALRISRFREVEILQ